MSVSRTGSDHLRPRCTNDFRSREQFVGRLQAHSSNAPEVVLSDWESDKSSILSYLRHPSHDTGEGSNPVDEPSYPVRHALRQYQRPFTADEVVELVQRYKAGTTTYELAALYGCKRQTISGKLRSAGVMLRMDSPSEEQIDEMVRLYESGLSLVRVGDRIGVSARTVLKYLRKRAVRVRDSRGEHQQTPPRESWPRAQQRVPLRMPPP